MRNCRSRGAVTGSRDTEFADAVFGIGIELPDIAERVPVRRRDCRPARSPSALFGQPFCSKLGERDAREQLLDRSDRRTPTASPRSGRGSSRMPVKPRIGLQDLPASERPRLGNRRAARSAMSPACAARTSAYSEANGQTIQPSPSRTGTRIVTAVFRITAFPNDGTMRRLCERYSNDTICARITITYLPETILRVSCGKRATSRYRRPPPSPR